MAEQSTIKLDDLSSLISDIFEEVITSDDIQLQWNRDIDPFNSQVRSAEKKKKDVDKIFVECETLLLKFKAQLQNEESEVRELNNKAKNAAKSAVEAQRKVDMTIDDDDDDDVKIVASSFDPMVIARRKAASKNESSPVSQATPHAPKHRKSEPSVANMREALAQVLQKQVPPGSIARPVSTHKRPEHDPSKWPEIKQGSLIYAKKYNDIWYPAVVIELQNPHTSSCQYRIKFESKGQKMLSGIHIAYRDPIHIVLRVGSRVIAFYRDDEAPGGNSFYAGIVAEAPSLKNQRRFLIFFDDGYAQYTKASEIHKVVSQSDNVWEDVYPESQDFIRDYLSQYPERPMVRLQKGQGVQTEWNGRWWTAKVMEVDASLVKMYFQADKRTEWIYRGSTRLEPLFKALKFLIANLEAHKGSNKGRRNDPHSRKPKIVYTRGEEEKGQDKRSVARKSTSGVKQLKVEAAAWQAPWLKLQRKAPPIATYIPPSTASRTSTNTKDLYQTSSISNKVQSQDMASVLQERLASVESLDIDEEARGERLNTILDIKDKSRKRLIPHRCSSKCLKDVEEDPTKHRGRNPLLIPLLCSWERHVCKIKQSGKRHVIYRTPCARRLRTIEEVDIYLRLTDSQLTIDLFCLDPYLHTHTEFVPIKTFCDIKDLSYGKENVPISCVNGIDRQYPDYVEYSTVRMPAKGVKLNLDPDFLPGCDCTDGCRDSSKCACRQLSVEHTTALGEKDPTIGYKERRLNEPIFTGIVECNVNCKCNKRCHNRVVQNGLNLRLQVFKTEKRGWGLRCLDDIPKGGFICIYAGQLLTDTGANEDGKQYGDEYLAELDFIEVVERQKEGYESDVEEPDSRIEDDIADEDDEEDDEEEEFEGTQHNSGSDSEFSARFDQGPESGEKVHVTRNRRKTSTQSDGKDDDSKVVKIVLKRDQSNKAWTSAKKTADWVGKIDDKNKSSNSRDDSSDELPDFNVDSDISLSRQTSDNKKTNDSDSDTTEDVKKRTARKSTGISRFGNLPNPKLHKDSDKRPNHPGTRSFFEDNQMCYIMDAKSMGNIGRYLNHSCEPNVFVQNIFVDTHDLRYPWVTFFAGMYIRAGTELTWDYNYEVGSVPDKVLYCYCGSSQCRGRLL